MHQPGALHLAPAVLGGQWTVQVDVTGHADARQMRILGYQRPATGLPVRAGKRLVPGQRTFFQSWLVQPGVNVQVIDVPLDPSPVGQYMATQATVTGGCGEDCNAYDLVLGFRMRVCVQRSTDAPARVPVVGHSSGATGPERGNRPGASPR